MSIIQYADAIVAKTITPDAIPVYEREQVQDELMRRYLRTRGITK